MLPVNSPQNGGQNCAGPLKAYWEICNSDVSTCKIQLVLLSIILKVFQFTGPKLRVSRYLLHVYLNICINNLTKLLRREVYRRRNLCWRHTNKNLVNLVRKSWLFACNVTGNINYHALQNCWVEKALSHTFVKFRDFKTALHIKYLVCQAHISRKSQLCYTLSIIFGVDHFFCSFITLDDRKRNRSRKRKKIYLLV